VSYVHIDETLGAGAVDPWADVRQSGSEAAVGSRRGVPHSEWLPWNMPRVERISFDLFLLELTARHGPEYLQRPDGEPLALVNPQGIPEGYAIPISRYRKAKHVRPTPANVLPPEYYSGNHITDIHPQMKEKNAPGAYGERLRTLRAHLKTKGTEGVTAYQLAQELGYTYDMVSDALSRHRGRYFHATERTESARVGRGRSRHYWISLEIENE